MELDDHAEELASDLGVDKAEVKRDLQNLVEYSVPIEEAKSSLRRKHGGDDGGGGAPTSKDVADVTTDDSAVTVTVRVLTNGKRSIRYQGEDMVIQEGEMADETGVISYTAWQEFGFEAGDSITVGNAGVREWDGKPELNLNDSTTVAIADEVPVEQQIGGDRQLIDLRPGDRGRNVEVRVLEAERKTIDGRDGETEILSGVLGDETARLPFTDWEPHEAIAEGASVRLEDVHVREFRGSPSVNVSEFTDVRPLDRQVEVADAAPQLSIGEAIDSGGMRPPPAPVTIRKKISEAVTGHTLSDESRQKISDKNTGNEISAEHRRAVSRAASQRDTSYMQTEKYSKAVSEGLKGREPTHPTPYEVQELSHKVRSSWEETVGKQLSRCGLQYEYEQVFDLPSGAYYADFVSDPYVIEVKGWATERSVTKAREFMDSYPQYTYVVVGDELPCDVHVPWDRRDELSEVVGDE
jgi:hypothetical protein